jgi:hypothetical protein
MAADAIVTARLDQTIALFNRRSMDLPDGLLDRRTQFLLNGTPFEAMLGRPADDPLVLMIARGPAGYRFAIKALQHALPDARVERGDLEDAAAAGEAFAVALRLSGHVRGQGQPLDAVARIRVSLGAAGAVARVDAAVEPSVVEILRAARLRD